jgi:16S rRNA (adenine1518-N6/adenine1519-N6)-dimethyltransferase
MAHSAEGNVAKSVSSSRPSKPKLGQHFLTGASSAQRIVDALGDTSQNTVLEIGPGRGALTSLLARKARRLIAVELDRVLSAQLRMKFSLTPNVEIIEADILALDFDSIFGPKPGSTRPGLELTPERVHVVGNLPYYITSELLLRLFAYRKYFDLLVVMVQKEVADRLAAKPGGSDYGLLSATAQLYGKVERLFTLAPGAFSPPPKVDSAVIRITIEPKLDDLRVAESPFIDFLRLSFGQKRKTLWNNLRETYDTKILRAAMEKSKVDPGVRAEALSLDKSAALFRTLVNGSSSTPGEK